LSDVEGGDSRVDVLPLFPFLKGATRSANLFALFFAWLSDVEGGDSRVDVLPLFPFLEAATRSANLFALCFALDLSLAVSRSFGLITAPFACASFNFAIFANSLA
jgi:hypothetical protein